MNFLNIETKFNFLFSSKFHVFYAFLISRFMLVSTFKKIILKSAPSLTGYILYSLVLILYLKCGGGLGGGCNVFLICYAIYNILETNIWQSLLFFFEKNNYFSFNVFFMFCYAGNIEKCPFTYWLNGRWFLQIVDIHREF